jgi:hypothetical protein
MLIDDTSVCSRCQGHRWPTTLYSADDAPICQECYAEERAVEASGWWNDPDFWKLTEGEQAMIRESKP